MIAVLERLMLMQWELILEKNLTSLPQNALQPLHSLNQHIDSYTVVAGRKKKNSSNFVFTVQSLLVTAIHY